jgi:hypothetical protein
MTGTISIKDVIDHFGDLSEAELEDLGKKIYHFGGTVFQRIKEEEIIVAGGLPHSAAEVEAKVLEPVIEDVRLITSLMCGARERLNRTRCGWRKALAWACRHCEDLYVADWVEPTTEEQTHFEQN